jgi:predicted Zn-dependent protease
MSVRACLLLISLTLAFFVSCETVPITGRKQVNLFSDAQMLQFADQEFAQFRLDLERKNAIATAGDSPGAAAFLAALNRVSPRIIEAAGMSGQRSWEVLLVKSDAVNANVRPNGKIVVFTGIARVMKNEPGIAAVLGHEVGHVVARHQAERMSQQILTQMGLGLGNAALTFSDPRYRPALAAAMGFGAQYGIILPFSRAHESEADHLGLLFMAKAGYDPAEAIQVWERMVQMSGNGPWEFVSTHPSPETRIARMRQWMPEAQEYYRDRSKPFPVSR